MNTSAPVLLSIVIKTLNEEGKIARAIESALGVEAIIGSPVEVIIADSVSTDRTIDIARRYPVKIVQFANPEERGCGAGVELGFQHSTGELIYFLDGDMVLDADFILDAVALLNREPSLAGVGGAIEDTQIVNGFDRIRVNNKSGSTAGMCRWLEGGGLYRRCAILDAGGYAADRNLKGYEEAELGMRLRAAGWRLQRLPRRAASHTGHAAGTLQLLRRHWQTRRAMSGGVLLRQALGKPWLGEACRMLVHPLAVAAWWALLPFAALSLPTLAAWGSSGALACLLLALRKRDPRHVAVSLFSWHYAAVATFIGLFARTAPVPAPISANVLSDSLSPMTGVA